MLGLMSERCGKFTGLGENTLERENQAFNRKHYLLSTKLVGLSPLGADGGGRSYLKEPDNPKDTHSRNPHCPDRRTDSTFSPLHTHSHLSLSAQMTHVCGKFVELYGLKDSNTNH